MLFVVHSLLVGLVLHLVEQLVVVDFLVVLFAGSFVVLICSSTG